jgi:hypothetical protein
MSIKHVKSCPKFIPKNRYSRLIFIPEGDISEYTPYKIYIKLDSENDKDLAILATNYGRTLVDIRNGDVIQIEKDYRNDGKVIWYNGKAIPLDFSIDEYGNLPKQITINSYKRNDYFSKSIEHNYIVWFDTRGYQVSLRKTLAKKTEEYEPYDENEKEYNEDDNDDDLMYQYEYTFTKKDDKWYIYSFKPINTNEIIYVNYCEDEDNMYKINEKFYLDIMIMINGMNI